jgi:hypothetical protein
VRPPIGMFAAAADPGGSPPCACASNWANRDMFRAASSGVLAVGNRHAVNRAVHTAGEALQLFQSLSKTVHGRGSHALVQTRRGWPCQKRDAFASHW